MGGGGGGTLGGSTLPGEAELVSERILGIGVICGLSSLLLLYPAPRGFSIFLATEVFPSRHIQKPSFPNANSVWVQFPNSASHSVEVPLLMSI